MNDAAHTLDLLVALLGGVAIGLLLATVLDEVERREAAKITPATDTP